MKTILHTVRIRAPKESVYQAITTQEGLSNWWTTSVMVEEGLGGIVDFQFLGDFNPRMRVTQLEGDRLVSWECIDGHDNWLNNTFSFELREIDGDTQLMFKQNYDRELGDVAYGTYNYNWGYYLDSLRAYCESGSGKPYQP